MSVLADSRPSTSPLSVLSRDKEITGIDRLLLCLTILGILAEIVVFIEPAPSDALLMAAFGIALVAGKLSFQNVSVAPFIAIGLFLIFNLISLFDPLDESRAIVYAFVTSYLALSWVFLVGLIGVYGDRVVRWLVSAYSVAGLASGVLGIVGYFHLVPHAEMFLLNGRASGLFKDCNVYGPFFVPIVLIALGAVSRIGPRQLPFAVLSLLTALLAIFLSFSRACWMNTAVSLAIYFLLRGLQLDSWRKRQKVLVQFASICLGASIALGVVIHLPAVEAMMAKRITRSGLQDYDRVRFATQELAIQTVQARPLGIGPGQSELVFGYATHSMYVRILSENGPLALVAFLIFVLICLRQSLLTSLRSASVLHRELGTVVSACIIGHLCNSAVIDTVHWRHIWIIYALAWVAPKGECRRRASGNQEEAYEPKLICPPEWSRA